jgi:bifunctional non-homologous end joining protein LigD
MADDQTNCAASNGDAGDDLLPPIVRPMLPTASNHLPRDESAWAFEVKWDGVRAIFTVAGGIVRAMSRNDREIAVAYPELDALGAALGGRRCVLDGEIVAFAPDGRPSFEVLQQRMHVRDPRAVAQLAATVPVVAVLFDLLWLDGESLVALPYTLRREALTALGLDSGSGAASGSRSGAAWRVPSASVGTADPVVEFVRGSGLEGVVAKRLDSRYEPGARSRSWLKVKFQLRQELVIGGFTLGERGRAGRVGALVLGVHDAEGRLVCCGKVGTGFSERELDRLASLLVPLARTDSPFTGGGPVPPDARFVEPRLVCEVGFAGWTGAGAVRHPTYLGLRDDKDPRDVVRET